MGRVLLAEDEEDLRLLMGRQLRRSGFDVTLAADGQAALELLMTESFDVVVSDIKMPRLDGMGLLAKAQEVAPGIDFIILTGHGSLENAVQAFTSGNIFDYKLKPLEDIHELSVIVGRAIERAQLRAENARLLNELREQAERDGLTGLYNHRAIHALLQRRLVESPEGDMAVILMDMDGFKLINDTYGHPFGDQALRHMADALRTACPESALIGRCGGDEFMVCLPGYHSVDAAAIAERIRDQMNLEPLVTPDGGRIPLQLCFGVADSASVNHSPLSLTAAADAALYAGKRQGGHAIKLHRRSEEGSEEETDRCPFDVLDSLITAIDTKDQYTRLHSENMTQFALQLVQKLGCSEETYNLVRIAGLLHDVGKIGIPGSILNKPGKLNTQEYEMMKNHVTISALIIHGMPRLDDIVEAVANHHERWDGGGYPTGLTGEQIPLLGRVMAIADAYSAMILDRPYRVGLTREQALEEIERGAGTQFDPHLAKLFVEAQRAGCAALPKAA